MNWKKITLLVLSFILAIVIFTIPNNVMAAENLSQSQYFGINEFRNNAEPQGMAYAIGNPNQNLAEDVNGTKIFQIVKYPNYPDTSYITGNYYCIKSRVGFKNSNIAEYNISFDFKNDKSQISNSNNDVLKSLVNDECYYKILALLDLFYLRDVSTEVDRAKLLGDAGINIENADIKDSDIEAVQQAALWYFSNYNDDLFDTLYNNYGEDKTGWLYYKLSSDSDNNYKQLSEYGDLIVSETGNTSEGIRRNKQAIKLYQYLIEAAKNNENEYREGKYNSNTKITLYTNGNVEDTQPIILIERTPDTKEFDLALRKYITNITKVDGVELSEVNSRIPDIDKSTIATKNTATYKHRKDPIEVEQGSIVTYKLTVYNEGEKAGRAKKIVDQLPEGLVSNLETGDNVTSTKGNLYTVTYDSSTNKITFTTTGTNNLAAYDGTILDSDTIEIKCTVIAEQDTAGEKILTNVAWIAEEYDAVDKITITTELGKDRDSEPGTTPSVNKDNMSNYKGTTSETDLSKKIYYPGEQDDDDFEKLKLPKKITGEYGVKIVKEDSTNTNKKLQGAIFSVTNNDITVEHTTGQDGIADVVSGKQITEGNVDIYTITEKTAPTGYNKFEGTIKLTIKTKIEKEKYVVDTDKTTMEVTDKNGTDIITSAPVTIDKTKGLITITVKDTPIEGEYGVKIVKEDSTNTNKKLQGAIFSVTNNDITVEHTTGQDGIADVVSGKQITEGNVDIYTITEKTAPTGYNKFEGTIKLTIKTKIEKEKYVVDTDKTTMEVTDKNGTDIITSAPVTIDKTKGLITITVKDTPIEGEYGVKIVKEDSTNTNKKLQGAIFSVTNNDITVEHTTGQDGIADVVSGKQITEGNVDIYTITEKTAPTGYNKFEGTIKLTIKTKIEKEKYVVDTDKTTMEVTDKNGTDIITSAPVTIDKTKGLITITVKDTPIKGQYSLNLVKEDASGAQLNSKATFEVNGIAKEVVGSLEIAKDVPITAENVGTPDTYVIKELVPPDDYCKFDGTINVTVNKKTDGDVYKVDEVKYNVTDENGNDITSTTRKDVNVYLNENGNIYVEVKNYQFDLKLIKRIVEVNGSKVPERLIDVDITDLVNKTATTADYKMDKSPVSVKKGDIVKYTLRVYNEGDIDGYASEITEDIPEGLEFLWSEKTDTELDEDTTLTASEKEAIKYNQGIWDLGKINSETQKTETVTTNYLAKDKGAEEATDKANLIKAFDSSKSYVNTINDKNPDYKEVSVYMKVISDDVDGNIIRNEAAITDDSDSEGNEVEDRDSNPKEWKKEPDNKYYDEDKKWPVYIEDDEDYDNIVLQSFDLSLRKFIIAVSNDEQIDDSEYLRNESGKYEREPIVDTSKLNTTDENENKITTAIYNHTKDPVEVKKNDIVVYMLRVYNEGSIDGYASEIKDHLPPYLKYVDSEYNKGYGWEASEDGRTVKTSYLDNQKISKAEQDENGKIVLSYKEVPIMCKVTDDADGKITNIADITVYKDENKEEIEDRDSKKDNVVLPSDKELPTYKDNETGKYIPGQEDDDDFEKVVVKKFDLALRKFITGVNQDEVTNRIPQVKYDSEKNQITYEHTKDPVDVVTNDIVIYTIRVFNEGEQDGFASKVSDDLPDGLEYLPDNDLNKEYRWVMYDKDGKETTEVSNAAKITTDYLSKEQGEARMKENSEMKENPALLTAFDKEKEISDTNPDYADVKIAFKVVEPNESDRIIINSAQISDDTDKNGNPVDDIDSTPDEWIEGEDDQDKEYIKLNYFDLALRKWVTHAIVIENGKETVTQTGHKAEDDPEQVVKVELNRKKLGSLTVKFKYSIRITNEGDIAGYAKEITDYIPEGLKFEATDNPDWIDEGNNVISTRQLENKLLQPGESAEVTVVLTWINGKDNLGLKVNTAEISEDYNYRGVPDIDSTPDNKQPGEDDIDDAPVLLSISTGRAKFYFTLGFTVLITIAGGIILIKRYVL